jgi:hypothetical protein
MTNQTTSPRLTPKFDDAMAYAAEKHRNQTRKGGVLARTPMPSIRL